METSWPFGGSNELTGEFDDPCPRPLLQIQDVPDYSLPPYSTRSQADHFLLISRLEHSSLKNYLCILLIIINQMETDLATMCSMFCQTFVNFCHCNSSKLLLCMNYGLNLVYMISHLCRKCHSHNKILGELLGKKKKGKAFVNSHKYQITLLPKNNHSSSVDFHFNTKSIRSVPGTVIFCGNCASTVNYNSADRSSVGERST